MDSNQTTIMDILDRGVQSARDVNPFHLEIAWVAFAYTYWASHIARSSSPKAYSKVHAIPRLIFLTHILVSLFEVFRYHVHLGIHGQRPSATTLDVVTCVAQCFSSFFMAAGIHKFPRGELQLTRATFQAMAISRLLATAMAIRGGGFGVDDVAWHMASTKLLQNFVYARFIIITIPNYVTGLDTYWRKYTAGIVGCHLMGLWEGNYPNGMGLYFAILMVLLGFDRWAQRFER